MGARSCHRKGQVLERHVPAHCKCPDYVVLQYGCGIPAEEWLHSYAAGLPSPQLVHAADEYISH